ncbi:Sua5/YciO/YrdC/YwlC family protein [Luteimonas sp. SJ-92]|uniref:Threonylcarbamoyl-AMP synthase n=1 Tax=Luteimonas salinisoli TaxID=2752307 RepID=A0A853JAZ2_9GAMM|nr:Sua5/YciO/YrdC/YwlC family protein [Luteimonas salinisoli]NZA25827.1 Sua5/YciO/YrdC/YwlC family protein [Luteimonas salinisoli]
MSAHATNDTDETAAALHRGAVVAYPTEAVWGLGCDPMDEDATLRLLALKQRPVDKGLILVAAAVEQFAPYADWSELPEARRTAVLASWPGPHTWIVPARVRTPGWIRGNHAGIALRVSAHPQVAALCRAFGGAIVSTSANRAGAPPPRTLSGLDPGLRDGVDMVLEGQTSGLERPTAIRDALSGAILR